VQARKKEEMKGAFLNSLRAEILNGNWKFPEAEPVP
jgi:hypothetical protein